MLMSKSHLSEEEIKLVETFSKEFKYTSDKDQYGKREAWYIIKEKTLKVKKSTYYTGDCEDYSLTVLYKLKGESMAKFWLSLLTRESKICFCTVSGGGHAVLKYKGRYVDNIQQKFVTKAHMESKGYVFSSWMYIPYQVAINLVLGKIYKKFRK